MLGTRQDRRHRSTAQPCSSRHLIGCCSRCRSSGVAGHLESEENLVFDVFVVAGVLALFGVVALIAKGVERL